VTWQSLSYVERSGHHALSGGPAAARLRQNSRKRSNAHANDGCWRWCVLKCLCSDESVWL